MKKYKKIDKRFDETYSIKEFADMMGTNTRALQYLDNTGKLKAARTTTGRRVYTKSDIHKYRELFGFVKKSGKCAIYIRVSNSESPYQEFQLYNLQKELEKNYIEDVEVYCDVGSGFDFDRPEFNRLLRDCFAGEIKAIYITSNERLTRIGYLFLKRLLMEWTNTAVISLNYKKEPLDDVLSDVFYILRKLSWSDKTLGKYADNIYQRMYGLKNSHGIDKYYQITSNTVEDRMTL